ncbi:MAG: histidine kinase dimerization/phospho-acceptor domain-containing protein [Nitrospiria bacterium]
MVEKLKETNRFKSECFSIVSRELRKPLTFIIGHSELLLDEINGRLNTMQEENFVNIQGRGTHPLEIINKLLDLSKVRAEKMKIYFGEFSTRILISAKPDRVEEVQKTPENIRSPSKR